jgi:thioesterase domain-containing protein
MVSSGADMICRSECRVDREPFFWFGTESPAWALRPEERLTLINLWPALYLRPEIGFLTEHFAAAVRALQPAGPYRLGGFCLGGLIAYEVARTLAGSGQEVAFLVMVHTVDDLASFRLRLVRRLLLSALDPATLIGYVSRRLGGAGGRRARPGPAPMEPEDERSLIGRRFHALAVETLKDYVLRPYDGRVILIEGTRSPERFFPAAVWKPLVRGGIEVHLLPAASWEELLRGPAVARKIQECLDRASADGAPSAAVLPTTGLTCASTLT